MENVKTKRRGFAAVYGLCPGAHTAALVSAALILLHLATRRDHALMSRFSAKVVHPIHQALAQLCSRVSFSVAEIVIYCAALGVLGYLVGQTVRLIRRPEKWKRVYITIMSLAAFGLAVYAGFCLLWGVYYYGDDFETESGLDFGEISTAQLDTVTRYFAELLNDSSLEVARDADGLYVADRTAILNRSSEVYAEIEGEFPCLAGPAVDAKPFALSRLMSYTDFTGFFFPFTGEANVNIDFPPSLFASTVAHELSHQRGVAREQEANFTAVLACLAYGDADYRYSACMLAYIHLGNALYKADREAWQEVYGGLNGYVRADMAADSEYWKQFKTPVQTVSNSVYEGFLQSYDQTLGLKSYGACVDLLVNYYYEQAQPSSAG